MFYGILSLKYKPVEVKLYWFNHTWEDFRWPRALTHSKGRRKLKNKAVKILVTKCNKSPFITSMHWTIFWIYKTLINQIDTFTCIDFYSQPHYSSQYFNLIKISPLNSWWAYVVLIRLSWSKWMYNCLIVSLQFLYPTPLSSFNSTLSFTRNSDGDCYVLGCWWWRLNHWTTKIGLILGLILKFEVFMMRSRERKRG